MWASSASDLSDSTSIASSARETSRIAYQTVASIRMHAPMVANTKPALSAHRGCRPVSAGTRNCNAITRPAPAATVMPASVRCSTPSPSTASDAETRS